ncbi:aminoglycoside phosphotransferase [Streptomyces sp. TRM 70351]|uniref:aminoglycoside phosphotransferase n=1 Tax=Streptomyces sp. TRM 70351 TaxID=3116552 RepID=UPI002E7B94D9|nr:aminoglycoside phosphotransferase [Streptomyces sp. TRM 70351]MEE1926925.1 aminoglycoside phosphotransferase [Streptomyces sp. TRM 70351]
MTPATGTPLPPPSVLRAFRITGRPEPLEGGQGRSVRAGDAVLKPAGDGADVEWAATLMDALQDRPGFRVPRYLRAVGGGHVVEGWEATRFLTGGPGPAGRWDALLAAGRAFHEALRDVPRPKRLDGHQHPWAVADRVAWGGATAEVPAPVHRLATRLRALREPVDARAQLVHGDLTGNVLFAPGQAPAVIDFSPYWRPVGYAEAIVVVDGLLHHRAGHRLADSVLPGAEGAQMLLRALIFRLVALGIAAGPGGALAEDEWTAFTRVSQFAEDRLAA